jgi:NADH dehydrogenase [ubiquinone] 1 alpha subcomplex assembly factor 1
MRLDPGQIEWQVINDGVMGGRSRSSVRVDQEGLHFHGTLSTAFGGGFASIRGRLSRPLGPFVAFRLALHGDGRRYQLRLRESAHSEDVAWRAFFDTSGAQQTLILAARDFEPVIRGRRVEALPGLNDRELRYIGFMLTSEQEGEFGLSVQTIETVAAPTGHAGS